MKYDDSHKLMRLFESIVQKDPDLTDHKGEVTEAGKSDTGAHSDWKNWKEIYEESYWDKKQKAELLDFLLIDNDGITDFKPALNLEVLKELIQLRGKTYEGSTDNGKSPWEMRLLRAYLNEYSDYLDDRDRGSQLRLHNDIPNHFDHPDRLSAKNKWRNYGQDLKNKTYKNDIKGPKHPLQESDKSAIVKEVSDIDATGFTDPDELDRQDAIEIGQSNKNYKTLAEKVMSNELVAYAVINLLGSFAWYGRKNSNVETIKDMLKRNEIYQSIDDESRKLIYNICTDTERLVRNDDITRGIKKDLDDAGMKMEGEKSPEDNKNGNDTPNDDEEDVMTAVEYFSKKK